MRGANQISTMEIGLIQALPMGALGDNRTSMPATMTDQTALRVANAVCEVRLRAAAQLIVDGVRPEWIEFKDPVNSVPMVCSLEVRGRPACLVGWSERDGKIEIELTWAEAWAHLAVAA